MKSFGLALVCAWTLLSGCKKADGNDCGSVIAGLMQRFHSDASPGTAFDEARGNYKATATNRCIEDKWGAEALSCLESANTEEQIKACTYKHLSQEQQDKLNRATAPIDLGGKQARTDALMREMAGFADKLCGCMTRKCADSVQDSMNTWSAALAKKETHKNKADEVAMMKLEGIGDRYGKCMLRAMTLDLDDSGVPKACRDVEAAYGKLAQCNRVPQATRDALREEMNTKVKAWKTIPADGREALAETCKSEIPQLEQSIALCE